MPSSKIGNICDPVRGDGRLQWNAGNWFGGTFGAIAWMGIVSCFLILGGQFLVAIIPAAGFSATIVLSLILWRRRDRLRPFPAHMVWLAVLAVLVPGVWMSISILGSPENLTRMNWPRSIWITALVFALPPLAILWLSIVDRRGPLQSG